MTLPTSLWAQIALVLLVAVPSVAILTKLLIWLVYCLKAPAHRSGSEEMELADQAELIRHGKAPYTSYEEWRKDVLSDKPLDQILGRVPEDFFKRHQQELKNPKPVGAHGAEAHLFARQRLAEIQARMTGEKDKQARAQIEAMRSVFLNPIGGSSGSGVGQPGGGNPSYMGYPGAPAANYPGVSGVPTKSQKPFCDRCGAALRCNVYTASGRSTWDPCPVCK